MSKRNAWPLKIEVVVGPTGYLCCWPSPNVKRMLRRVGLKTEGRLSRVRRKGGK